MPRLHFGFEVNAAFLLTPPPPTPPFPPCRAARRYLDTAGSMFSASVTEPTSSALFMSLCGSDTLASSEDAIYFYFSSDPRSFLGLGLTFLHWTPY